MQFDINAVKPAQIKREKIKSTLQQPTTLYPALLGFLGGVGALLFGGELALFALAGGSLVALSGWAWEYLVKGEAHATRYVEAYRQQLEQQRKQTINKLRKELLDLKADRASHQLELFQAKFDTFNQVLQRKLNPTELTFNRYMAMAEQLFLNGLDNLEKVALALSSVAAIDINVLDSRIAAGGHAGTEIQHLLQRRQLYAQQHARVQELVAENEGALTKLDEVSTRLANTDFSSGKATMDMEHAIKELTHLIETSQAYQADKS